MNYSIRVLKEQGKVLYRRNQNLIDRLHDPNTCKQTKQLMADYVAKNQKRQGQLAEAIDIIIQYMGYDINDDCVSMSHELNN